MAVDEAKLINLNPDFTVMPNPFASVEGPMSFDASAYVPPEAIMDFGMIDKMPMFSDFDVKVRDMTYKDGRTYPMAVLRPKDSPDEKLPCLYYIHGGGFFLPYFWMDLVGACDIARRNHCLIVTSEYVQSPEAPFPAGLEECYELAEWIWDHADDLNIDTDNLVMGGESGGATFTAALSLMLRDRNSRAKFTGTFMLTPLVDNDFTRKSMVIADAGNPYIMCKNFIVQLNEYYVRDGIPEGMEGYAFPLKADCLEGLPPAYIEVAEYDALCDEGLAYASRLSMAGVPTVFNIMRGAFHGWLSFKGEYRDKIHALRMEGISKMFKE